MVITAGTQGKPHELLGKSKKPTQSALERTTSRIQITEIKQTDVMEKVSVPFVIICKALHIGLPPDVKEWGR